MTEIDIRSFTRDKLVFCNNNKKRKEYIPRKTTETVKSNKQIIELENKMIYTQINEFRKQKLCSIQFSSVS